MFDETVDIIIPIWNQLNLTQNCLTSIINNTKMPYRLILIDNGSDKETADFLDSFAKSSSSSDTVALIRNTKNLGFTKAVNQGLRASEKNRYKILLNNDCEVPEGWLTSMRKIADSHPNIGMVGPLNTAFDEVQYFGTVQRMATRLKASGTLDMLSFFCVLIKPTVVETIGLLDENMEMFCSDDAYCKKARDMNFILTVDFNIIVKHWHRASSKLLPDAGKIYEQDLDYLHEHYIKTGQKIFLGLLNQDDINGYLMAQIPKYLVDRRFRFTYEPSARKPITNNRNHIVTDFLATDCEILWMIDSCINPPDDILNLLLYNKDIIAAPCPLWSDSDQGSWVSWNCGYIDGDLTAYPALEQQVGLQPIDRIGTGCMFIKREVLEAIKAPFLIDYDENGHLIKGLDFRFCDIAREKGFEVFTHWGYQCDHKKNVWLLEVLRYSANSVRQYMEYGNLYTPNMERENANCNGRNDKI